MRDTFQARTSNADTVASGKALSIVIPVFNESENIPALTRALTATLTDLCRLEGWPADSVEIIFVDDGSTDDSWELIAAHHVADPRVGGVRLSRQFGHHPAITAGLDRARGEAVVVMDGDLQDPPEAIPALYAQHRAGFDLVYAIRQQRRDRLFKRVSSWLFWSVVNRVSGLNMPGNQMMLRILSRRLVDALGQMGESARFVHGMMAWAGFQTTMIEVAHGERLAGRTKYSLRRQIRLALYAITSFSTTPLRMASVIGVLTSIASVLVGVGLVIARVVYRYPVQGWASIVTSMFFLAGVQLFVLGIIGEYLGKTYQEVQRRPLYLVREWR